MPKITFTAVYGSLERTVEIEQSNPNVTTMTIYIDRSYVGSVILYARIGWTVVPQKRDRWTTDDKEAILGRLFDAGMLTGDEVINWSSDHEWVNLSK